MPAIYKGGIPYTGDTEAKYVGVSMPDSTLNMQELTENLLGDMATVEKQRAQAVHDTGDFLVLDGQLYKCTASIAVGDRLAVGTNIAKTNAGSELGSLKGEIATLKSSSLTITPGSDVTLVNNNSVKNGKMVAVNAYFQCASVTQGTALTAGTLPEGARPANETAIIAFDASTYDFCGGWLTSTGLIRVVPKNTATNRQIRVCCAFLAS